MKVSIILCTLSRPQSMERLLASLAGQSRLPDEIIVVDASEDDKTEQVVNSAGGAISRRMRYQRSEKGLTKQRNNGLKLAGGDIIGFFDDDVKLEPDYLEKMISVFEADKGKEIGAATGIVHNPVYSKTLIHKPWNGFIDSLDCHDRVCKYYRLRKRPEMPFEGTIDTRHLCGCSFFRKEVFDRYSFDEWFEGYGLAEDKDMGLRVAKSWRMVVVGQAQLWHLHEPANRPNYRKIVVMNFENHLRVLRHAREDKLRLISCIWTIRKIIKYLIFSFSLLCRLRTKDFWLCLSGLLSGTKAAIPYCLKKYPKDKAF